LISRLKAEIEDLKHSVENRIQTVEDRLSNILQTVRNTDSKLDNTHGRVQGNTDSIQQLINNINSELKRIEQNLATHVTGNFGSLSDSIIKPGGFWSGIWLLIAVQAAAFVIYEYYRSKKDDAKKYV
jgi:hypothetical protein